jgi:hypothetical protein
MSADILTNISKILERDSKATTYKFALLRGVIDIIQENSPYINVGQKQVEIPIGLMIERWIIYYYPIVESKTYIPQIHGAAKLAFDVQLSLLVLGYKTKGGFSAFYNDLVRKSIPADLLPLFMNLIRKLRSTITQMPMRYIGSSINKGHYTIFQVDDGPMPDRSRTVDLQYLIRTCGTFSIPAEYYEAFRLLGRFVGGRDSILMKWAEFSANASPAGLEVESVLQCVLKSPVTEREVSDSKKLYAEILATTNGIHCVWTGNSLTKYDIDHLIPFSAWKNNDLWNLLPSSPQVNNKKRDKIPSPELIHKRRGSILSYWELLNDKIPERFQKEVRLALIANVDEGKWQDASIEKLKQSCAYLIESRGYEGWQG